MFISIAPTSGDAGCPRRAPAGRRPTPAGAARPAAHSPGPLRQPRRGLETFPAPTPTPSFPVGASWPRSRVSARSYPNSLLSQPARGGGSGGAPSGSEKPWGNPSAGHRARSLGNLKVRARQGPTGSVPGPRCLSWRYLLACGGVPEQPASPGAVSPRSCPCWLLSRSPYTRGGGRPAAPRCCPEPRRPRVNGSRSPTSGAPGSPLGRALPDAGFATKFAGQGRGRWPGQGGPRQCPARDQPGWRGGGRGRTPPQLLRDHSELPAGAGPPEPVTHLPNPAPARPRSLPPAPGARATAARRPRCACDRRHRPSGRAWFSHWLLPGCVPPLGPTQPGARPAVSLPGRAAGELCALNRPGCVPSSHFPSPSRAPAQAPPSGEGPLGPLRNRLAQSRRARDLGVPRLRGLRPTIGCGGACAERLISWPHPLPLPQSLARVMAAATALGEAAAPMGALCGLVQDFVMGQQEGPADQVAAGMVSSAARHLQGPDRRERPQHPRAAGRE